MPRAGGCRVLYRTPDDIDTEALLPERPDRPRAVTTIVSRIRTNRLTLIVVLLDVVFVVVLTSMCLAMIALTCDESAESDILELCRPFEPVDKVAVDLDFGLLVHCDMPKSCVAYAQAQMEARGFNYNFIIGDEELVYVGKGYRCGSDALRIQMLVTRYTWDPRHPVYKVPDEVVTRYIEVISEGLRCGKLSPNYTVTCTCGMYGEWCRSTAVREQIPWLAHEVGTISQHMRITRHDWHEPAHPAGHPFLAFDQSRVYEAQYRLAVCNPIRLPF